MDTTHAQPSQKRVLVIESAIAELQRMGWVTETEKDGATIYKIAIPAAQREERDEWPEIVGA